MFWVKKIKEDARGIFMEHPASIVTVFILGLCRAMQVDILHYQTTAYSIVTYVESFFFNMTFGLVLCECHYACKKHLGSIASLKELGKSYKYLIVLGISLVTSIMSIIRVIVLEADEPDGWKSPVFLVFGRFQMVFYAACIIGSVYYMYKKAGESFESYAVKAFLGCLKAFAVYLVMAVGALCIIWVFDSLIVGFEYTGTVEILIGAIVGYPAFLLGLSATGEKTSRFSNIMVGYVFTGILAVAAVIVYAYIIKILVIWEFPSNEAYSITTALFACGMVVWTMAQGCTQGRFHSVLRGAPLFFAPFIAIQIICIGMRIGQYGITAKRYLGVAFVVFEICYLVYYIVRLIQKKGLGGFLFPVALILVLIYFLVPGINVYAAVTASQKGQVLDYLQRLSEGEELTEDELRAARSSFVEIQRNGDLEGISFIEKVKNDYSQIDVEEELDHTEYYWEDKEETKYINVYSSKHNFDVEDYEHFCDYYCLINDDSQSINIKDFELEIDNGEPDGAVDTVNLEALFTELEKIYDNGGEEEVYNKAIEKPLITKNGAALYFTRVHFNVTDSGKYTVVDLKGYYLYK